MLIVVNPAAAKRCRSGSGRAPQAIPHHVLPPRGTPTSAQTERPRHATEIAAGAAEYDTVIALGGDGVVHEVACGLMRIEEGRRPTSGVIPVGSEQRFRTDAWPHRCHGCLGHGFLPAFDEPGGAHRRTYRNHLPLP
ncbi:MAG: acylglycerol kinase family protein [Collinsella sp.]